jgi:hypothetical protein
MNYFYSCIASPSWDLNPELPCTYTFGKACSFSVDRALHLINIVTCPGFRD